MGARNEESVKPRYDLRSSCAVSQCSCSTVKKNRILLEDIGKRILNYMLEDIGNKIDQCLHRKNALVCRLKTVFHCSRFACAGGANMFQLLL